MQKQVYNSMFTVENISLMAYLGIYDEEQANRQPIRVTFRLYFPGSPSCFFDDHADFINYQYVVQAIDDCVETRKFRLIEHLNHELYHILRNFLDDQGANTVKIWLSVCKIKPNIPQMQGGASFVYSDLPADATITAIA